MVNLQPATDKPTCMAYKPHLGYYIAKTNHLHPVRELTDEELAKNEQFMPIYKEAANRLKLFKVLNLNFDAWAKFTNSLLSSEPDTADNMLVADQLLLNFLATAYAITEHFKVSYRKRFKKNSAKIKEYEDFLDRLCAGSWATAFFFDFRNYVQHNGLPVGRYNKVRSLTKVEITIEQDPVELLNDYKDWKRSKLNASRGKLDLISLSRDYHLYLQRDYAAYVAKTFYPDLIEIHKFYAGLAAEATNGETGRRMLFITNVKEEGTKLDVSASQPPNDPMGEIGILVEPTILA